MKLQFSLATLLVCMTVLAVVCAIAVAVPVFVEGQPSHLVSQTTLPSGRTVSKFSPIAPIRSTTDRHRDYSSNCDMGTDIDSGNLCNIMGHPPLETSPPH